MVHYSLKKKYLMTKSELLSSARGFLSNHNVATTQTAVWTSNTQQVFNQSINSASYQLNVMYLFCFQRLFSCFLTRRFLHVVRTLAACMSSLICFHRLASPNFFFGKIILKNKLGGTVNDRSCRSFIQLSEKQQQNGQKKKMSWNFLMASSLFIYTMT